MVRAAATATMMRVPGSPSTPRSGHVYPPSVSLQPRLSQLAASSLPPSHSPRLLKIPIPDPQSPRCSDCRASQAGRAGARGWSVRTMQWPSDCALCFPSAMKEMRGRATRVLGGPGPSSSCWSHTLMKEGSNTLHAGGLIAMFTQCKSLWCFHSWSLVGDFASAQWLEHGGNDRNTATIWASNR